MALAPADCQRKTCFGSSRQKETERDRKRGEKEKEKEKEEKNRVLGEGKAGSSYVTRGSYEPFVLPTTEYMKCL